MEEEAEEWTRKGVALCLEGKMADQFNVRVLKRVRQKKATFEERKWAAMKVRVEVEYSE